MVAIDLMTIEELKKHFVTNDDLLEFELGESDTIECKKSVRIDNNGSPRSFDDSLRAIAALANNKGGILLYGIAERKNSSGDKIWEAVGLTNKNFKTVDPGNVSMLISDSMMPFVKVTPFNFQIGDHFFAGFNVEESTDKPVLAIKNTQDTKEGCIYFRYPGQSKPIKHGELATIIAARESAQLQKISKLFSTIIALSDDESIPDIQSHLEGLTIEKRQESRRKSSAKLKDGSINSDGLHVLEQGVAVSDEDIIESFIFQRNVKSPMSYVSHYCQIARVYLPIYYYLNKAGYKTPETRVQSIKDLRLRQTGHVEKVIERVSSSGGLRSNSSNPEQQFIDLLNSEKGIDFFDTNLEPIKAIRSLRRIHTTTAEKSKVFTSLQSAWRYYQSNPEKSFFDALCYATCNVDYWFFE